MVGFSNHLGELGTFPPRTLAVLLMSLQVHPDWLLIEIRILWGTQYLHDSLFFLLQIILYDSGCMFGSIARLKTQVSRSYTVLL